MFRLFFGNWYFCGTCGFCGHWQLCGSCNSSVVGGGPPEVGDSVKVDDSVVDGDSVVIGICVVAIIGAD